MENSLKSVGSTQLLSLNEVEGKPGPPPTRAGERTEATLGHWVDQTLSLPLLLTMTGAGVVGRVTYARLLGALGPKRLIKNLFWGQGARLLATAGSLGVEAPAFTLIGKGLHQALGHESLWDPKHLGKEVLGSLIFLGSLKGSHALGTYAVAAKGVSPLQRFLFPQAATLGGTFLALQGLEQAGLKPKRSNEDRALEALGASVHFQAAGFLSRQLLPKAFDAYLHHLEFKAAGEKKEIFPLDWSRYFPRPLNLVPAGPGAARFPHLWFSKSPEKPTLAPELPPSWESRGSSESPDSERPDISPALKGDIEVWAAANGRSMEEAKLLDRFVHRLYGEMWNSLAMHSQSPVARSLARGRPLTVRIETEDGSLENYRLGLMADPKAPQAKFSQVQWTLDPARGTLTPQEFTAHAIWKLRAQREGKDITRGFVSFYSNLRFTSEALKANPILRSLPEEILEILTMEPTLIMKGKEVKVDPPPKFALHEPIQEDVKGPTILMAYFPLISQGARQAVDRYAEIHGLPPYGQRRLHRLVHFALAGIRQREQADPRLGAQLGWQFLLKPKAGGKGFSVQTLTGGDVPQGPPGEDTVLLTLYRMPYPPHHPHPVLQHQYLHHDRQGNPVGADLKFQEDLGLKQNLSLYLPHLRSHPSKEDLEVWEEWMERYNSWF